MDPTLALAAGQDVLGLVQTLTGDAKAKRLLQQRTAYHTPEEINKILEASQNMASSGYDPATLNFLLNQTNQAYATNVGAALRLGANPNDLSSIFDAQLQNLMKIGSENHALNMNNLSRYLDALNLVATNKAAEWQSEQDILKDKLQAASAEKASGIQNILSGVNAGIGIYSADKIGDLYKVPGATTTTTVPGASGGLNQQEIIKRALLNRGATTYSGVGLG